LFNIVGGDTTSGLWSKLEILYVTNSMTSRIYLKRQLYCLWMKEGTKIVDHLNTFNTLIVQLTTMEIKFEDEDKAITLLCLLPESWDNLVTPISFSSTDFLDYDSVVGALLAKEMKRKSSKETSTSEVMLIRGRIKENNERRFSRSKSRHRKGKAKCWYCGKTGHLKKYCWKRKESEKNSTKEANLVVTNSGMIDQVLSVSSILQYQEEWQLDSCSSHHMCSHRNWFISYQFVDEGVVFMGNGIPCKTVGVGSIRIMMFYGTVRELTDGTFLFMKTHQGHKRKKELQVLVSDKSFLDLKSLFLNSFLFYTSASYDDGIKGCCVWDPTSHKVIIDRNIVCMEQPKGLIQDRNGKFVCMLDNSLYGLLVPRKKQKRFESFIVSWNF
jgi:hypothetical protein